MITINITSPRHIAAATVLYNKTCEGAEVPPYQSVSAYCQAAMDQVCDSWVQTTRIDEISPVDFIFRFTPEEYAAVIEASKSNPNVGNLLSTLSSRTTVRLGSTEAITSMAYLVSIGLISEQRSGEILAY